jgi:hypothetical protein
VTDAVGVHKIEPQTFRDEWRVQRTRRCERWHTDAGQLEWPTHFSSISRSAVSGNITPALGMIWLDDGEGAKISSWQIV